MEGGIVSFILALLFGKVMDSLQSHDTHKTDIKHRDGSKTEIEMKVPRK